MYRVNDVLMNIEEQMCVCVCDGDGRWFSVGTRGPVGVDNPTAEASSWGRG